MSKVINDWASMIEEASQLILEDQDYIYPYTGDTVIDEAFSSFTLDYDDSDEQLKTEDKPLYKLLQLDVKQLEEYIEDTNFDFDNIDIRYYRQIKYIKHYLKKENKTLEELVYLIFEIDNFTLKDKNGNFKTLFNLIEDQTNP